MEQTSTYVYNAATFCDEVKKVTKNDTEMMASYYIVSLNQKYI